LTDLETKMRRDTKKRKKESEKRLIHKVATKSMKQKLRKILLSENNEISFGIKWDI
jgi:hypothetical protein